VLEPSQSFSPQTSRYGSIGEGGEWRQAIEAYYQDNVEAAYQIALSLGAGFGGSALNWYRMIEGEALARQQGTVQKITDWLQIEKVDNELQGVHGLEETVQAACEEVAERLGWTFEVPTLVTVLVREADNPWHGARFGYAVDKVPYDKVCVPNAVCHDPEQLRSVIAHEYSHIVTLNLTDNRAPQWLEEGIAMFIQGEPLASSFAPFHARPSDWLSPHDLDLAFGVDRRDAETHRAVRHAYQQAAVLVHYLHSLAGEEGLRRLLRAFTNNSLWDEVKINVLGAPSVEEALHEVYKVGQGEVFELAFKWSAGR
jgi:hypothetical protein